MRNIRIAFIVAKGLATGLDDVEALNKHLKQCGMEELSEHDVARTTANLQWGTQKEPYALKAMKSHLPKVDSVNEVIHGTYLRETGFMPCDNVGSRCAIIDNIRHLCACDHMYFHGRKGSVPSK